MRWYLSGPMSGLPDFNRPAFREAARRLRDAGAEVLNPVELCPPGLSWDEAMAIDLAALETAGGVIVLPGWEQSRGARREVAFAELRGMLIVSWDLWWAFQGRDSVNDGA